MNRGRRTQHRVGAFACGVLLSLSLQGLGFFGSLSHWFESGLELAYAAISNIEPDGDGTVTGTPTTCGGLGNFDCLDDGLTIFDSPPSGSGDFVTIGNTNSDYYTMESQPGVDTVNQVVTNVYHLEGDTSMALHVSLWDGTETTQYGTEVQLPQRTSVADWDTATITTALSQTQLNDLKVRLRCDRPGGGKPADCNVYAMYSKLDYTEQIDVVVSSVGTQQDVNVGETGQYVGGTFVISEDTSSRNLTDITITETGSVDAINDLVNVSLYYEQVADCSVASYDGTETQFGSSGSFTTGEVASFTDSVTISTANVMCVYVVVDVHSTAMFSDEIDVQIANPSTDLTADVATVVSPSSAITLSGTSVLREPVLTQTRYHWRQDNGDEGDSGTGADSATGGTESSAIVAGTKGQTYRLRLAVSNEGNATADPTQFRLEYAENTSTCAAATGWTDVGATTDDWDMALSSNIADGNTSNLSVASKGAITDDNTTFVGTGALREATSLSGSQTLTATEFTELEYSIASAVTVADGTFYCFRVTDNGTELPTYTTYPEITFTSDLLLEAEETQVSTISIPSTDVYVGGFAITDSTAGTHDISDITITASTTASTTAAYDNIRLYWELDTDATPNCVSETYNAGLENQFGSTDTDGFAADGTSAFTEGVSLPTVSETQAVCVYVVLDVTSVASDSELLDIAIADPANDVIFSSGTIAPRTPVELSGMTTLTAPYVVQTAYHWRDNQGTEAGAGSLTGGVPSTLYDELPDTTVVRLRLGLANTGAEAAPTTSYRLEWAQRITTCNAVTSWNDIDTGGDDWEMVASQLVDGANTSNVAEADGGVPDTGTFTAVAGQEETTSETAAFTIPANSFAEVEYSLRALSTVTEGSRYCFRVSAAGSDLDEYQTLGEARIKLATDVAVTRGVSTLTGATLTLTEGVDYDLQLNDASRAFIRITNSHMTGGGPAAGSTGNHNADDVTAYIANPGNLATSIDIARAAFPSSDTQVAWEVVEYVGNPGGENEFIVRDAAAATYGSANTSLTGAVTAAPTDDNDVVVFITGQYNPDTGRQDYNTGLSTAAWDAVNDQPVFTRGEAGADAAAVSYAVVEFTGANWKVQRAEHTYAGGGTTETESITAVNSLSRAFVHAQHRTAAGADLHADYGHEVWLSSIGAVSFRLNGNAQTPTGHVSVAWVVENVQNTGTTMIVTRSNNTIAGAGGGLTTVTAGIGKTLRDITTASFMMNSANAGANRTYPEPMIVGRIINDTQFQLDVSDDADTNFYRVEIIEWPTASRKLVQNDYQLYEDNDTTDPTVPYAGLGENAEMTRDDNPLAVGDSVRIRMNLTVTASAMPSGVDSFILQYAQRPEAESCTAQSAWLQIGDPASTTAAWRGAAATPADGTTITTLLLSTSDVAATYEKGNPSALTPNTALVGEDIEFDWHIQHNGAADKSDFCFRMVEADGSPLESYSTHPVVRTVGFDPIVSRWDFYDDSANVTPLSSIAGGENVTPSGVNDNDVVKLRMTIAEQSGAPGINQKFAVQFSEYADFTAAEFVSNPGDCAENDLWCYADGAGVNNALIDSAVLSDAATCTGGTGAGCGTHNEATSTVGLSATHDPFTTAEYEFTLQNAGARVNAVYYFRLVNISTDELLVASTTYPSVLTASSSATFTNTPASPGLTVDGYTNDATTTAATVPFGSVPFNDENFEAIQRFTIDINATEGYRAFAFTDQPLTSSFGETINNITGTNDTPVAWTSGCTTPEQSCFGYHTSDDVLSGTGGQDVRFAADDTFAAFSTAPEEVFYSSVPGADVHDIVYKLQVGDLQPAGDYRANVTYVIVPVF